MAVLISVLTLAAGFAGGVTAPARADMMTACATEIQSFCSNVNNGRGRISACLASRMARLNASCQAEVQGVMQSRLTPGYVRQALAPGFTAPLPPACVTPAKQFCSGLPANGGAVFACLYAYSDRIPKECTSGAQAALKQTR